MISMKSRKSRKYNHCRTKAEKIRYVLQAIQEMYTYHFDCTDLLKFTEFTKNLTDLHNISSQYDLIKKDYLVYLVQIQKQEYILRIQAQIKKVIRLWEKIPETIRNQDGFAWGKYDSTRVDTKKIKHRLDILKKIVHQLVNLESDDVWEVADGMRLTILRSDQSHVTDLLMQLSTLI